MQLFMIYFSDFLGKGLTIKTYLELSFYVAIAAYPHTMPLAILFSSIVSLGNLGESLEVEALKTLGISLIRIIRSLLIFSLALFIFSYGINSFVVPKVYINFITLLRDMQNKKPDIAIREGVFYDGIPGYSVRIAKKNKEDNSLEDIMIYDHTKKKNLPYLTIAKKGKIYSKNHGKEFVIELIDGHNYIDIKNEDSTSIFSPETKNKFIRSNFKKQTLILNLEALGFHRSNKDEYKEFKKSRNIFDLEKDILEMNEYKKKIYQNVSESYNNFFYELFSKISREKFPAVEKINSVAYFRELFSKKNSEDFEKNSKNLKPIAASAKKSAETFLNYLKGCRKQEYKQKTFINDYAIHMKKMFTWAFSCISVMILGATLGVIMKRGGLGIPLIISGILIVIHYIIEMISEKWGKYGVINPSLGAWASNLVIIPLGIFFYYVAYRDIKFSDFKIYNFFAKKFSKKKS